MGTRDVSCWLLKKTASVETDPNLLDIYGTFTVTFVWQRQFPESRSKYKYIIIMAETFWKDNNYLKGIIL